MNKNSLADIVAEQMDVIINSDEHMSLFHKDAKKKTKPCCDCKSCGKKCPCEEKCKKSCSICTEDEDKNKTDKADKTDKTKVKEKVKDKSKDKKGKGKPKWFFGKKFATAIAQLTEDLSTASEILDSIGLEKSAMYTLFALDGMLDEAAVAKFSSEMGEDDMDDIDDPTLSELGLESNEPMGNLRSGEVALDILNKNPDLKKGLKNRLLKDYEILQPRHEKGIEDDSFDPEILPGFELNSLEEDDTDIDDLLSESLSPTQFPSEPFIPGPTDVSSYDFDELSSPLEDAIQRMETPTVPPEKDKFYTDASVKNVFTKLNSWMTKHSSKNNEDESSNFEDEE